MPPKFDICIILHNYAKVNRKIEKICIKIKIRRIKYIKPRFISRFYANYTIVINYLTPEAITETFIISPKESSKSNPQMIFASGAVVSEILFDISFISSSDTLWFADK